jgi:dihydroorotase
LSVLLLAVSTQHQSSWHPLCIKHVHPHAHPHAHAHAFTHCARAATYVVPSCCCCLSPQKPLLDAVPMLRVVLEHITTADAAEFVLGAPANVAATVTPQHMLLNRNALFVVCWSVEWWG